MECYPTSSGRGASSLTWTQSPLVTGTGSLLVTWEVNFTPHFLKGKIKQEIPLTSAFIVNLVSNKREECPFGILKI